MNELDKLKQMLDKAGIPYVTDKKHIIPNIIIFSKTGRKLCDAIIQPECTDEPYLEIMGALTIEEETEENSVLSYLNAEEVFERFSYCYKHNTKVYVHLDTIKK